MRSQVGSWLVVAALCCVVAEAQTVARAPAPAVTLSPDQMMQDIMLQWVGEFDNHQQVRANLDRPGPAFPELTRQRREMKVFRLDAPQLGKYVVFFEEYRENLPGRAHRQRVMSLVFDEKRQQVRARQFFFKGDRYGRQSLDPAVVARMPPTEFNLSRPFCDLWFTTDTEPKRYRARMQPGACTSIHPDGAKVYADYEMLLQGSELWYRDRSIRISDGALSGEIDGFSWLMFTRSEPPHITKQQGVWRGTFRRYGADGKLAAEFPSEITMRVIPKDGKLLYHQTNHYFPAGKPEEWIESYGEVRDGRVYFGNERLDAWKMDVPADPTGRSAVILMQYKDGSDMYVHEIVSVSSDGRHRARATQYLKDGVIVRRTLIDEEKVTDDWAAYDAEHGRK